MELVSVYHEGRLPHFKHYRFIYHLLAERDDATSLEGQAIFLTSHPYSDWWLVRVGEKDVGAAYLTVQREVGVLLKKEQDIELLKAVRSAGGIRR